MKKCLILLFLSLVFFIPITVAQNPTNQDVYSSKELIFYGYDYTHFKLADPKRIGQDINSFIPLWNKFCNKWINEKYLKEWLNKEKVTINQEPTLNLNKQLSSVDLVTDKKETLSIDSIQDIINQYSITEKEGLGFVIILECYDNESKTVSAYYTFIDISTQRIIRSDYFVSRDRNSYNRVMDWGVATLIAMKKYAKFFQKEFE